MNLKPKVKNAVKWLGLAVFLGSGAYASFYVPAAVESFLPAVETILPEKAEYCRTVQGSGFILRNENGWYVQSSVNESDIRFIQKGQKAVLNGAAFENAAYSAVVEEIADYAKQVPASNGITVETVVEVTLKIENPDENLRSGYTAQTIIDIDTPREVTVIPYDVIRQDDDGEYVYVLSGNTAVRRGITTGEELYEGAELLSGLSETDEIIIMPGKIIDDTQLVKKKGINEYKGRS